ncbi:MAG TPA: cytochrome P450, partial [Myxococcaceae bacterium]|nr:cytochrome P450 [Myxococcaceae bacterium]
DDPALAEDPRRNNDFRYGDDPLGQRCPVGAHVRRANPRDSSLSRYVFAHRMLRRGMPYGPPLPEGAPDDGQSRGLMFLAYNASISEQFELVQQQWLNSGNVSGHLSSVRDPISPGEPCPRHGDCPANSFTVPEADGQPPLASRTLFELPRFVTVKGGEYFFVPGLRALAAIAQASRPSLQAPDAGFLQEYRRLGELKHPSERLQKQSQLLEERLFLTPGRSQHPGIWAELREQTPLLSTPLGVLVSRFQDTCEVLGRNDVFSVREYDHRMQLTTGPFFLGFDDTDRYQREASLGRMVVRRNDLTHVRQLAEDITHRFIQQVQESGQRLDVASLAALALVRVIGNYFGVAGPNDKSMLEWFPAMSAFIFPPFFTDETRDAATRIGPEVQRYLDGVIAARRWKLAHQPDTAFPDDVLQRLLELRDEHGKPLDDILVRRQLAGMVSGSLVATAGVLTGAYRFFVGPGLAPELRQQLMHAVEMNDDKLIAGFILEFARKEPTPSLLYRYSVQDYTLARGTARETFIPQGTLVVCGLASAMADAEVIPEPDRFWPGRPDWVYLNFGFGQHACLGRHLSMTVMTAILKQLLRLRNPRIVHDERGFPLLPELAQVPGTPSPERLIIEYEGWDDERRRGSAWPA